MATADLITSFLSNEMSPERERQFLLSVAASDALRLELKSHMLLDRILLGQAQRSRVPDAIRASIFAAAGVGTAAVTTTTADAKPTAPTAPRGRFFTRFGGRAAMLIAAAACFGAGYYVGFEAPEDAPATPRVERAAESPRPVPSREAVPSVSKGNAGVTEITPTESGEPAQSRVERRSPATSAAAPSVTSRSAAPTTEVSRTTVPPADPVRDPATRNDPRRKTPPYAGVETTIKKSSGEASTPAEPQK